MYHLFYNALIHEIYLGVSGECSPTIDDDIVVYLRGGFLCSWSSRSMSGSVSSSGISDTSVPLLLSTSVLSFCSKYTENTQNSQ